MSARNEQPRALTGRIGSGPGDLLRDAVLDPQMRYELEYLLPMYVAIETVLAAEYLRLGLISPLEAASIARALESADREAIGALGEESMHDICFALERHVERELPASVPAWHADRSRNDTQACAQLMLGRRELAGVADALLSFGAVAHSLAGRCADILMPGYTHFQAAQIISPGFYLAALSGQVLHTLRRLLATYDEIDYCPLGAGAMAGQQLGWDRDRMARLLGFRGPQPLALTSVACRAWVAEITAELGLLGVTLSRFCTDLINWGGSEYGFIDLPDALSGISSAMPQKKNFPVLERIRGKTAHLTAMHLDTALGQRNTPYTNLVEVSKEASANLIGALDCCRTVVALFTAVLHGLTFRRDRMADACARDYFGAFSLANSLTLSEAIPWRTAQVIVGCYVAAALEKGRTPGDPDAGLLTKIAAGHGYRLRDPAPLLAAAFDVSAALRQVTTAGSAHPDAVRRVLDDQDAEYSRLGQEWSRRREATARAMVAAGRLLCPVPPGAAGDDD